MFSRNLAFIIGINNYKNGISSLKTAVNDAKQLVETLRSQHGYQVWVCLDEVATLTNLNQLLEKILPEQVSENDRLLFYFAGHGVALNGDDGPAGYLIPQDAKQGDTNSYLPMTRLHDALSKLPCRHFLGILDCCFSGAFRWSSTRDLFTTPEVIHKERYDRFITDPAWQIITSSASDQKALDNFNLDTERGQVGEHSPFAAALLQALEGEADCYPPAKNGKPAGDGVITATELYLHLRDTVEIPTEESNLRQTPGIWCLNKHDKGEYIFLTPGHELNLPPAPPLDESKNPYRSLSSFDEEHSELFFGRSELVEKLQGFVENHPLTIVLGASGSGKSSLVKAGLIPNLKQQTSEKWFTLSPIRPGETPFQALNNALVDAKLPKLELQNKQKTLSESIAVWVKNNPNSKLLIFIDQSEEIITLCKDENERKEFFQQILTAINAHRDKLRVVLTLRSDFEPQVRDVGLKFMPEVMNKLVHTQLSNRWQSGRFIVPAMTRRELREVIEKPAEAQVMYFEPHDLVEELINEVADMPGALPLLSFALSELFLKYLIRQHNAQFNQGKTIERAITKADYEELGGVMQSLTRRADEEYELLVRQNPAYEQVIRHIMLRMVALTGGELARRRVPLSELEYPEEKNILVAEVIKRFSDARLLVEGQDAQGNPYVEPAHDALVRGWEKLLAWRQKEEENLILQRRLKPAAEEWKIQQQTIYLWNSNPYLDVLNEVLNSDDNWLNEAEAKFVEESIRRKRNPFRRFTDNFLNRPQYLQQDEANPINQEFTVTSPENKIESENNEQIANNQEFEENYEEEDEYFDPELLSDEDFYNIGQSFKNDLAKGPDLLNIENELNSLAEILVMRDLQPPLAVGICGGWGSGKSYAMHLMQKKITEIRCRSLTKNQAWGEDKSRLSLYVGHIYQIRFDAWTFAKSNLWSSLMQTIFFEFNRQVTLEKQLQQVKVDPLEGGDIWKAINEMNDEEREALLKSELSPDVFDKWKQKTSESNMADLLWETLAELRQEAKENLERSEDKLKEKKSKLKQREQEIEEKVKKEIEKEIDKIKWKPLQDELKKLMEKAFIDLVEQVEKEFNPSGKKLGQEQQDKLFILDKSFQKSLNKWQKKLNKINNKDKLLKLIQIHWKTIIKFVLFLGSAITIFILLERIKQAGLGLLLSLYPLYPTLLELRKLFKEWNKLGNELIKNIDNVKQKVSDQKEKAKNSFKERCDKNCGTESIVILKKDIKKLEAQVEHQKQAVGLTAEYNSLSDFVNTRLEQDSYRKQLGQMQQIQRDLTDLTNHLTLPQDTQSDKNKQIFSEKIKHLKEHFPRGSTRVILYIDDLDRCPPNRVVEVLESVQLLLKTRLFVVVLAIDDRYIARALENVYKGVLKRRGQPSGIDYLEKIIQIPYRMRSMTPSVIESYLKAHMQVENDDFKPDYSIDDSMKSKYEESSNVNQQKKQFSSYKDTAVLSYFPVETLPQENPIGDEIEDINNQNQVSEAPIQENLINDEIEDNNNQNQVSEAPIQENLINDEIEDNNKKNQVTETLPQENSIGDEIEDSNNQNQVSEAPIQENLINDEIEDNNNQNQVSETPIQENSIGDKIEDINNPTPSIEDKKPKELSPRVTKFSNKEFNILRYCCQQVNLSPRTVKRLINIYKIIKIIWFRENNLRTNESKQQHIKQTMIAFLALSARYPQMMRDVFIELETRFEEERDLDRKLVEIFLIHEDMSNNIYLKREWNRFSHDVKKLIPQNLTLEGMTLRNFNILLSFCFVGDLGYDPDDFGTIKNNGNYHQTTKLQLSNRSLSEEY